jgi:hypothetical protein
VSDRSALQLYVYAMPAEDQAAVQLGIEDNGLEPYENSRSGIVLGVRYMTDEVPVGSAHDLAVHLLTHAPGRASSCGRTPCMSTRGGTWRTFPASAPTRACATPTAPRS